jgi:drug/metabolite transporter (DMT)-like permease
MTPSTPLFIWLAPALSALFLYGVGQGLVKKYISEVPPARFCLFFVVAKALVNLGFYFQQGAPSLYTDAGKAFFWAGTLAYILDGAGWILYFKSIIAGPITIVGTLSAAYPALTVIFARIFLAEVLSPVQYGGVALVILGCIGLSYSPPGQGSKITDRRWVLYAGTALVLWGAAQTIVKYSYSLPEANEVTLSVYNTLGGFLTLGIYGLMFGRKKAVTAAPSSPQAGSTPGTLREWMRSFLPMAMMAGGDLGVLIASRFGPVSIVSPLTGAYPVVTLGFAYVVLKETISKLQWFCILMILIGMYLSPGSG